MALRRLLSAALLLPMTWAEAQPVADRVSLVNTMVGTAYATTASAGLFGQGSEEHGQTLPAVLEPNGMNFWTPQTQPTELKCVAPYYDGDSLFYGFRNSHWIVGGCTQDYGSFTVAPAEGPLPFSHADEESHPDYYAVGLGSVRAELTARSRSAIMRFTYASAGRAVVTITPNSDEGEGWLRVDTVRREVRGENPVHRIYQGWGQPAGMSGWFVLEYQDPLADYGTRDDGSVWLAFNVRAGQPLLLRAASSFTDVEGARRNLQAEIPHWNFGRTRHELHQCWQQRLGRIDVEGEASDVAQFYGALYRASFLPRTMSDADGRYPLFGGGGTGQTASGHAYYGDFSLWDTYRALHPLLNIIEPQRAADMMQSLVLMYEQGGWMPIFPCWNSYTAAMIGDHVASVVADAYVKGIHGFDVECAYEGLRQNAFTTPADPQDYRDGKGRRALLSYLHYGYIPLEDSVPDAFHQREQVSRTLEYAYDDFCLSRLANLLGHKADERELRRRARNYRHVIDPATGYAQGRHADGTFLHEQNHTRRTPFITEGAPCHYTFYVPHDVPGLMQAMGGRKAFLLRLDSLFRERRYWHGNEPCHQAAYLFALAGQPEKTRQWVGHILRTEYADTPGGLSGNDDAGQMSAWQLFAMMGFYPVCPGTPYYVLGGTAFRKVTIHQPGGPDFKIEAAERCTLDGKSYRRPAIAHSDLLRGATLGLPALP